MRKNILSINVLNCKVKLAKPNLRNGFIKKGHTKTKVDIRLLRTVFETDDCLTVRNVSPND